MRLLDTRVIRSALPTASARSRAVAFGVAAALAVLMTPTARAAEVFFNQDCLPPNGSEYVAMLHQQYAAGLIDLRNPIHDRFTMCDTPPSPPGAFTVHSFGSTVKCEISMDGGATYQPHQAPAQVTVRVENSGPSGPATLYDTEMLQLDITGGSFPPGVMVRESPTLASTGKTTIRPVSGGFQIDSFFDVFTELSVDGGLTWQPSEGPPGHMTMQLPQSTGTRHSTWGLVKALYRR